MSYRNAAMNYRNAAMNRRKVSSRAGLPNENIVGLNVIDAADDAMIGTANPGGMFFPERGKGGAAATTFSKSVCEQLHHKTMYAPVTKITARQYEESR